MTTRQQFLDRVRTALGRSVTAALAEPAPTVDDSLVRLVGPADEVVEMFAARAEGTGMDVHRVTAAGLADAVVGVLRDAGVKRVLRSAGQALGVEEALERAGISWTDAGTLADLPGQFDFDAGITDVHAALAETGSLVMASSGTHSRGPSLIPPLHLAVVRRQQVLPDMIDLWRRLAGEGHAALPSSIALISGPSKTADIEGILITGVHGPKAVHIFLVD